MVQLSRLRVQNFMSLRDVTIDFDPLTIFIGPNASGKSGVFKALMTVSKLLGPAPVRGHKGEFFLEAGVHLDDLVWRGNSGLPIQFEVWFSGDDPNADPSYLLQLAKDFAGWSVVRERIRLADQVIDTAEQPFQHDTERRGTITVSPPYRATLAHLVRPYRNDQQAAPVISPLLGLASNFGSVVRYRASANDIASFAKTKNDDLDREMFVRENGWGLPLAMQHLIGVDRVKFERIEAELKRLFPHIRNINFETERFGVRLAFSTTRSEDLVPASQESDGVLLTTFLLWRLLSSEPNLRICLEEPENGMHPYLLHQRFELLRQFTKTGSDQDRSQVMVATHSPDFLTALSEGGQAHELSSMIRLVEYDPEQGTRCHRLSDLTSIDALFEAFSGNLGELWWSGAIGAVPSLDEREA